MVKKEVKQEVNHDTKNLPYPPLPMISCGTMKYKILELLQKGGNPHSISRDVGRRRSTIIEHLHGLKKLNLVDKGSYLWYITEQGKDYLGGRLNNVTYERKGVGTSIEWLQDRCHNIKIKYNVTEKPSNRMWLSSWKKNDKIKNNVFYTKRFGEIVTTFTGKSIIFQLPILKFKNPEIAISEAGRISIALKDKYELEIIGLKLGEREVTAQLITQHHAIPQEPYAKFCYNNGISYKDDYIDIDASKTPELEFTDKNNSHIHHERYIDFIKDTILNNPPTNSQLATHMLSLTKNMDYYGKNLVSHVEAIQTLSKEVKRLSKVFKSTIKENRKYKLGTQTTLFDYGN